jgi:hypothetical protein
MPSVIDDVAEVITIVTVFSLSARGLLPLADAAASL